MQQIITYSFLTSFPSDAAVIETLMNKHNKHNIIVRIQLIIYLAISGKSFSSNSCKKIFSNIKEINKKKHYSIQNCLFSVLLYWWNIQTQCKLTTTRLHCHQQQQSELFKCQTHYGSTAANDKTYSVCSVLQEYKIQFNG